MNNNRCIECNAIIPEGLQVCPICDAKTHKHIFIFGENEPYIPEQANMPPNCGTSVQKPNSYVQHIHCDISKEFLGEYKAEIERATATDIIDLLEVFNKNGDNTYAIKLIKTRFKIERKTKEEKAAVEVVRCRDCKHNEDNGGDCNRTITHTSRNYVCEMNEYKYISLEFCSYGERIEK